LWEYSLSPEIAWDYDDYFAVNSLFEFDEELIQAEFSPPGLVADLGCGTGRALHPLLKNGHRGLAIDLSEEMLHVVGEKAALDHLAVDRLKANLVELDCLRDNVADYCICMFSTLGMICGKQNRALALQHTRRILKPGGKFILHVHNLWSNVSDPLGRRWLAHHALRVVRGQDKELGDKFFDYRGVPNMFLHVFRRRELAKDLLNAGFAVQRWTPLNTRRRHKLRHPWFFETFRANGWIIVCQ